MSMPIPTRPAGGSGPYCSARLDLFGRRFAVCRPTDDVWHSVAVLTEPQMAYTRHSRQSTSPSPSDLDWPSKPRSLVQRISSATRCIVRTCSSGKRPVLSGVRFSSRFEWALMQS